MISMILAYVEAQPKGSYTGTPTIKCTSTSTDKLTGTSTRTTTATSIVIATGMSIPTLNDTPTCNIIHTSMTSLIVYIISLIYVIN